jgi:hypothetical protein
MFMGDDWPIISMSIPCLMNSARKFQKIQPKMTLYMVSSSHAIGELK